MDIDNRHHHDKFVKLFYFLHPKHAQQIRMLNGMPKTTMSTITIGQHCIIPYIPPLVEISAQFVIFQKKATSLTVRSSDSQSKCFENSQNRIIYYVVPSLTRSTSNACIFSLHTYIEIQIKLEEVGICIIKYNIFINFEKNIYL